MGVEAKSPNQDLSLSKITEWLDNNVSIFKINSSQFHYPLGIYTDRGERQRERKKNVKLLGRPSAVHRPVI